MDLHSAMALRLQVVEDLKLYHPSLYALYNLENIVLVPTHTHSGAGTIELVANTTTSNTLCVICGYSRWL